MENCCKISESIKERVRLKTHPFCCINENHALDAWFNKTYGGEQKRIPP